MTLSKTKKKDKEQKESLVKSVRDCLDQYTSLYIFSFENMRNIKFKEFKEKLKSSSRYFSFPLHLLLNCLLRGISTSYFRCLGFSVTRFMLQPEWEVMTVLGLGFLTRLLQFSLEKVLVLSASNNGSKVEIVSVAQLQFVVA